MNTADDATASATPPAERVARGVTTAGPGAPETAEAYATLFAAAPPHAGEPQWLGTLRRDAIRRLVDTGFPTTKDEDWHFTSPAPITAQAFAPAKKASAISAEQIAPYLFDGDWHTVVFVNGVHAPALSAPIPARERVVITTLASVLDTDDAPRAVEQQLGGLATAQTAAFTALNTAFFNNGALILLGPNAVADRPIHILHVTDGTAGGHMVSPRTLVYADHHAEATIVESFVSLSDSAHFTNAVSEVYLSAGARVRHYKVQREALNGLHVGATYAHQEQDSNYESFSFAVGAALSRTNISTVLDGPGAHATMNGLYMVTGSQTVDHQTRIEHAKENCTSHEVYRGILDGDSHAVFNGKVYVQPEAQKTDGKQSNNNLLLSDRARVDTKPQLEIFADDVKCTHGATVGRLDATALFYLKSRGVGKDMAQRLLTYAFAADVLEELTIDVVKEKLEQLTFERFAIES
jgi:Fe-S cluster assembly protein SufD